MLLTFSANMWNEVHIWGQERNASRGQMLLGHRLGWGLQGTTSDKGKLAAWRPGASEGGESITPDTQTGQGGHGLGADPSPPPWSAGGEAGRTCLRLAPGQVSATLAALPGGARKPAVDRGQVHSLACRGDSGQWWGVTRCWPGPASSPSPVRHHFVYSPARPA